MSKTDITTTIDNTLPSYLQGQEHQIDKDNFDASDVVLPQIKLLQGTSAQCTDFEKAQPGIFWHTGMDVPLGEEINFTIISRKKKYLLQAPLDDGQGILARAEDAETWDREGEWTVQVDKKTKAKWVIDNLNVEKSGLTAWGTFDPEDENSPPAATLFYEYLVILNDHLDLGPAVISTARSQIKQAKKGLNTKIDFHQNAGRPMQALVFTGKPITENGDAGDYFNWNFASGGFAPEEVFNSAMKFKDTLTEYKVQDEGNQDEAKPQDDGEGEF